MDTKITITREFSQPVDNARKRPSIVESLAMPEATDVEFEPPRLMDSHSELS